MAADIPAMTNEISCEELALVPSRRWAWSPWTWLSVLVCLIGFVAFLEIRILRRESVVASQLRKRGYQVEYDVGWLQNQIPRQWYRQFRLFGDRIVAIRLDYLPNDLKPLDDLVPQLQKLECLRQIQFIKSHDYGARVWMPADVDGPLMTSRKSLDRCLAALKAVDRVKSISLSSFDESEPSEELIKSLEAIDVEQVCFFSCRVSGSVITRLKSLPHLKEVLFLFCEGSEAANQQLKQDRPDITVEISP